MHSSNQENKEESKTKSPSRYGYRGVIDIFIKKNIDHKDWVVKEIDKARGGVEFMLPNAEGQIILDWDDLYYVDVTFVNSRNTYKESVSLATLEVLISELEDQRQSIAQTRDFIYQSGITSLQGEIEKENNKIKVQGQKDIAKIGQGTSMYNLLSGFSF